MPASSKEFLDIQATIECGFTLKHVRDTTRTYSRMNFGMKLIFRMWLGIHNYIWFFSPCDQPYLSMPKVIASIKYIICQDWIELSCWIFAYGMAHQIAWIFYKKYIFRKAWSFEFIFSTTVERHDRNLLTKFWSLMTFGILCGCPLKSSLFIMLLKQ